MSKEEKLELWNTIGTGKEPGINIRVHKQPENALPGSEAGYVGIVRETMDSQSHPADKSQMFTETIYETSVQPTSKEAQDKAQDWVRASKK